MKSKMLLVLFTVIQLIVFRAGADALQSRQTVEKFFANYGLIGNWPAFMTAQSQLLSPNLMTVTSDPHGIQNYTGPSGYFASLGDWSKEYSTGPDFHMEIVSVTPEQVVARLHGKLSLREPIQGHQEIQDSEHQWTEVFHFGQDGTIAKLEVLMNLFKTTSK